MMEETIEEVQHRTYDSYKESNFREIDKIPEHWTWIRGNYIFKSVEEKSKTGGEELLSVSEHNGVKPRSESNVNMFMAESYEGYKLCYPGDLVINSLWAWSRGLGISDYKGIVSTAYSVFRPDFSKYDKRYLDYLLRSKPYVNKYLINSKGIWISRLQLSDWAFLRIPILTPPKKEQDRIASFLDQKTTQIDKAIAQKELLIELLNERRQIFIHKAVTQGLNPDAPMKDSGVEWIGAIPEHWEKKRLKWSANVISDKIISKNSPLDYVGMENVESWTGNYVETDSDAEGQANIFEEGDILFGKLRPYLAKVYLCKEKGLCSGEFLVLRSKSVITEKYLQNILLSPRFIDLINSLTYGAKMPRANWSFIGNQEIPIPPDKEQEDIVNYINSYTEQTGQAIRHQSHEIEALKEFKKSLINSAVTGKIKV